MATTHPLAHRVTETLEHYYQIANRVYGYCIMPPRVEYNLRGHKGGIAYVTQNRIRLNTYILETQTEAFLKDTVPHEFAHLVACHLYGNHVTHGLEWKQVMRAFGLVPARCHTFLTKPARTTKQYRYICSCRKFTIGPVRHKRMSVHGKKYTCKACRKPLVFLNEIN